MIEVNKVTSQSSCIITNSTFTHNTVIFSSGQYSNLSQCNYHQPHCSGRYEKLWTMLHVQLDGVCIGILNLEVVSFWLSIMWKLN